LGSDPAIYHYRRRCSSTLVAVALALFVSGCPAGDDGSDADVDVAADTAVADTVTADDTEVTTGQDTGGLDLDSVFPRPDTIRPEDTLTPADVRLDTGEGPAVCVDDDDCAWCATPKPPSADPNCHCPECNVGVILASDCAANAEAWHVACDGRDAEGNLCPVLECKPPGPARCREGVCFGFVED